MRRLVGVLGAVTMVMVLATVSAPALAAAHGATGPSSLVPATHLSGAVCVVSGNSATSAHTGTTPFSVPAHPDGVDVVWLPGLDDKSCKAVLTRGTVHVASALASDINGAPVVPAGRLVNCPMDDGTSARLYFTYRHGATERVDADLSGCSYMTVPGHAGRSSSAPFRRDLTTLAPSAWRAYVSANPDPTG